LKLDSGTGGSFSSFGLPAAFAIAIAPYEIPEMEPRYAADFIEAAVFFCAGGW
jgi:hypothetical protein